MSTFPAEIKIVENYERNYDYVTYNYSVPFLYEYAIEPGRKKGCLSCKTKKLLSESFRVACYADDAESKKWRMCMQCANKDNYEFWS